MNNEEAVKALNIPEALREFTKTKWDGIDAANVHEKTTGQKVTESSDARNHDPRRSTLGSPLFVPSIFESEESSKGTKMLQKRKK